MKDNDKIAYEAPTTEVLELRIQSRILENSIDPLEIIRFLEDEDELDAE